MIRILKYLKPHFFAIIAVILFVFIQVQTDLSLPDYMSKIVTNGIQYEGIEEKIPLIIDKAQLENLDIFLNDEEKVILYQSYELINDETINFKNKEIKVNKNTYILKDDYDPKLIDILSYPLVYDYYITTNEMIINTDNINETIESMHLNEDDNIEGIIKLEISNIYEYIGINKINTQTTYILKTGLIMLVVAFIGVIAQLLSTYFSTTTSAKVGAKMRHDVFEKVESFSSNEFSHFQTSSLITRTTNDITKIQDLIQTMLRMMLMAPIMGLTAVGKVIRYPQISWILLFAIAVIILMLIILLIFAFPKFEIIQKLVDKINNITRELLDGILVIRAFNAQEIEEKRFDDINSEVSKVDKFVSRLMNTIGPVMTFTMNSLTIAITWFASKQIALDVMSIGDMMAFIQYAMHVVMSFMFVTGMFVMIPRSLVSMKRIEEVLDTINVVVDKEDAKELEDENGELIFHNVSFKYPGAEEYVLKNINLIAKPGESIAFIGSTGSGKSTLLKLIPRLFDVSDGKITYCNIDLRDLKQKSLHDKIGYATQKALLFSGDIKSNITFGRDVNDEELKQAIKISQSENIITEKEDGLSSLISQGGTNVSGGQKQRLSIARALAKQKNIYLFDDSFSALDYETDKKLRKELEALINKTKATIFIVAQRIATIRNCDKIIVLDNGEIVGEGKHLELLNNCKVYQEIAKSQLSKEELEYAATIN